MEILLINNYNKNLKKYIKYNQKDLNKYSKIKLFKIFYDG